MLISDWSSDVCSSDLASKDDLYGIFYTGGTTGRPKGIMLSHDSMMVNALIVNTGLGRYKPTSKLLHVAPLFRSEEHTSELQSLMRISYAVFCLKKKKNTQTNQHNTIQTQKKQHH